MTVATHPLDDPAVLALDASGMFTHIRNVGGEFLRAWDAASSLRPPAGAERAEQIVICGVGGSATAADYLVALTAPHGTLPISVVRGYSLPNFVSARTLVIVCSYSGNTEEMLSLYGDARRRGAMVVVITRGGQLGERAAADANAICWQVTYDSPPRAAMVHSLAPLLRIGAALGVTPLRREDIQAAGDLHRDFIETRLAPHLPFYGNEAKQLALAVRGRLPMVIGAEHLASAAVRFRNQLAENGKTLAVAESLPEAGHNLVVGLGTASIHAANIAVISLESPACYHPRIQRRFEVIAGQFAAEGIPMHRIEPGGGTILQQMLQATAWGDYVSCYLGLLNGFDPTPIPQIEALRQGLDAPA